MNSKTILITGASTGFGRDTVLPALAEFKNPNGGPLAQREPPPFSEPSVRC